LSPADFDVLCDVIRYVARAGGLTRDDADDFAQSVHLKLLENNFAPFRRFSGRSSLRTFLTVVVKRLLLDWRNARYGKWRPSVAAQRLGSDGVTLDRLIARDGHPVDEAIAIMESRHHTPCSVTLRALASRLSKRPRTELLNVEDVERLRPCPFVDPVESALASAELRRRVNAMRRACRRLTPEDRLILTLRFRDEMSITAIAARLEVPAKPMFRRLQRILRALRQEIAGSGGRPRAVTARARAAAPRVH
jgi:RNA polymerase sigma factor (sigma-70 family)